MVVAGVDGRLPLGLQSVRFSIRGLIRLDYAPAWFVLGLFFERLHRILVILTPSLMQLLRPQ